MNWIIPNKIVALSSPTDRGINEGLAPENFFEYFKTHNVKHIIRLNDCLYHEEKFRREGIEVHNMEFSDGSCPADDIIAHFISTLN